MYDFRSAAVTGADLHRAFTCQPNEVPFRR